ncbi:hypothetical protein K458DRAFT_89651 [Lentithecium fluviatile CBS 122367]|uniref:Uncharacterized protein n=1 Tax=Lentithecium fluviatile CBS 122367 TaxID=1168545 RepID=A0A6G1ISS8_9PLEO|nr:hypothetical protein K458DRAFT_89651 [Lentithecium fluviatile CBS 122367]
MVDDGASLRHGTGWMSRRGASVLVAHREQDGSTANAPASCGSSLRACHHLHERFAKSLSSFPVFSLFSFAFFFPSHACVVLSDLGGFRCLSEWLRDSISDWSFASTQQSSGSRGTPRASSVLAASLLTTVSLSGDIGQRLCMSAPVSSAEQHPNTPRRRHQPNNILRRITQCDCR